MAKQKINPNQQNNAVTQFTNTNTAGGTFYYMNLGGLKLFWGMTNSIGPNGSSSAAWAINFPSGFFTTVHSSIATPTGGTTAANQFIAVTGNAATTTSGMNVYLISTNMAANTGQTPVSVMVIGA